MTIMSIETFLKVGPKLPPFTSILLRAPHGVGKSKVTRTLGRLIQAANRYPTFEVIDRRLGQLTEGDIVGLPSTDGEVTRFNPPDWYKKACKAPCLVFLDELNRGTNEVMQAAFQIVLDHELNGWKLHPETRVVSAVNVGGQYNVNEIDPALLDRFFVVDLAPTTKDFLNFGDEAYHEDGSANDKVKAAIKAKIGGKNIAPLILDFIRQNDKWLNPPKNAESGKVGTSRRSWEALSDALVYGDLLDKAGEKDGLFYPTCVGFIGVEATTDFMDFAKTVNGRFTGEELLNGYTSMRPRMKKLFQKADVMNAAVEKVADFLQTIDKVTPEQGANLGDLFEDLLYEHRINLWSKITSRGIDKLELAKSVHPYCIKHILDVFDVPFGQVGVGVQPNIPGMFKQKPVAKK